MASTTVTARQIWRIGSVTAATESSSAGRIWSTAIEMALPLAITVLLWRGLYAREAVVAGVTHEQAATYAVVAALLTYLRVGHRGWSRDAPIQHIRLGTILYWFLWPLRPARYHAIRGAGDIGYALAWAVPAYAVCLVATAVTGPVTVAVGVAAAVSFLLGQMIGYLIGLLLDLMCFWTLVNEQVIRVIAFVQALLSGGFAPLWFFPEWFQTASRVLPFASIVNLPMSIYTGRASGTGLWLALCEQLAWCLLLGFAARALWRRAVLRVDVLGG